MKSQIIIIAGIVHFKDVIFFQSVKPVGYFPHYNAFESRLGASKNSKRGSLIIFE